MEAYLDPNAFFDLISFSSVGTQSVDSNGFSDTSRSGLVNGTNLIRNGDGQIQHSLFSTPPSTPDSQNQNPIEDLFQCLTDLEPQSQMWHTLATNQSATTRSDLEHQILYSNSVGTQILRQVFPQPQDDNLSDPQPRSHLNLNLNNINHNQIMMEPTPLNSPSIQTPLASPLTQTSTAFPQVKFECSTCTKTFSSKRALRRHRQRHFLSHEQYFCDICRKPFSRREHSRRHEYTHMTLQELVASDVYYEQCQQCSKVFWDRSFFKKHLTVHTEADRVPCSKCGKMFKAKGTMTKHLRKFHPETK